MKRVIALLLVVLMAVSLCGCSKEQSKGPEPGTALNTFYQAIMEAQPENAEELILSGNEPSEEQIREYCVGEMMNSRQEKRSRIGFN